MYIKMYNVTDVRTGKHHSIAIVDVSHQKWFVQEDSQDIDYDEETN